MVKHRPKRWMSSHAPLEHLQMARCHERIECQIVFEDCAEGRIERGAAQPQRVTDVLYHRAQSLELSGALSDETANSIRDVIRFKIHPTDDAGNRRMTIREIKEKTRFCLGRGRLDQD